MNKAIWVIIILIIVVVAIVWAMGSGPGEVPADENGEATSTEEAATTTEGLGEDEPSEINDQLEGINIDELEDEFEDLDENLENL